MDSPRALPAGNYSSRGHVTVAAQSAPVFFSALMQNCHQFSPDQRHALLVLRRANMKLPANARLGSTLYFKSPSLGEIMFIDVDVTPDDDGEVDLLPEGIAELTGRWCVALNRIRKVNDFRPATREEVPSCVQRYSGAKPGRAPVTPKRRLARPTSR